jgi:benzoyl-CoA reductase/2-hydroxyglutaryl-CoA dehydratase subunit BcrC/BadD/HgdB
VPAPEGDDTGDVTMNRTRGERAIVLTTCSCVPEEIIEAAGLQPARLLPLAPPADADSHIHPNTCGYLKSLLAAALDGKVADASCIVIANGCDGMRKLYDLWGAYVDDIPALFLDVPKKKDADSVLFFASELRRFAKALTGAIPAVEVTNEGVRAAIEIRNRVRELMGEVFRLQREKRTRVRGSEVFDLCMSGVRSSAEDFIAELETFLANVEQRDSSGSERRILLTGNVIDRPDPIAAIEELGGSVVVLDTCIGLRHYQTPVEENAADPMLALANRYLMRSSCPRMEGLDERYANLEKLAAEADVDGIVFSCVKFCDPLIYDIPTMSDRFRSAGNPFLYLENDYTWSGSGQMKTRLQAFSELRPKRSSRDV